MQTIVMLILKSQTMKKLMLSFAVLAVGAAAYFGIESMNTSCTTLMMKNVEDLAAGEAVHIPCVRGIATCRVDVIDGDGHPGVMYVDRSIKRN